MDNNKAISEAPSADLTVVPSFTLTLLVKNNKILNQERNVGKLHLKAVLYRSFCLFLLFHSTCKLFDYVAVSAINFSFFFFNLYFVLYVLYLLYTVNTNTIIIHTYIYISDYFFMNFRVTSECDE